MASEQDASDALERWHQGKSYEQYGARVRDEESEETGFLAGYEAGHDELRDRLLKLWDDNDGWIAGADFARLARVLGVEPRRVKSHRMGGESTPSVDNPAHRNIALY